MLKHKNSIEEKRKNFEESEELVRLHVQIRRDLELKIVEFIYHTKIDPAKKKAPDLADRGLKVGRNARKL